MAAIATLQDMEYNIDFAEMELGVLSASKTSDAGSRGEQAALTFVDLLCAFSSLTDCGARLSASDAQHVVVTLTVLPSLANADHYVARLTIQRSITDKANRLKLLERVGDGKTYQAVFDSLAKAIFLEVRT
jgi:hypothetical protein